MPIDDKNDPFEHRSTPPESAEIKPDSPSTQAQTEQDLTLNYLDTTTTTQPSQPYIPAEATQENVQTLGSSQLYESNKVQEWAEEVNDGSNQSTWSVSKDVNGATSSSSHEDLPQPVTSDDADHEQSSRTSAPDLTVNGVPNPQRASAPSQPKDSVSCTKQNSFPTITEHLLQLATTKIWSDWILMVNVPGLQPLATYAHGFVLVRGTRLPALMQQERNINFANNVINLYPPREILPQALEAALRFLYSDTVVSEDFPSPKEATFDNAQARAKFLNYILSYLVAGIELGIPPVTARALQLLEGFVDWDVAELTVKEAEDLIAAALHLADEGSRASEYLAIGRVLKHIVLRFLSEHLNAQKLRVNVTTAPSGVRSRFGFLEDSRLRHNPALAAMVFGSMPSSADLSPSSPQSEVLPMAMSVEEQTLSNVLLNVDFSELEYFHKHLRREGDGSAGVAFIESVVKEREKRRLQIVSSKAVPNKHRIANSAAWDVAAYREYVEDGTLKRERVGFLLPTKGR
jgi:hypothetical protein